MDILSNKSPAICKRISQSTSDDDYFPIYEAESPISREKHYLLLKHFAFKTSQILYELQALSMSGRFLKDKQLVSMYYCTGVSFLFYSNVYIILYWSEKGENTVEALCTLHDFILFSFLRSNVIPTIMTLTAHIWVSVVLGGFAHSFIAKGRLGIRGCRYKKTTLRVFSKLIQSLLKTTGIFSLVFTGSGLGPDLLILKRSPIQHNCYLLQTFSSNTQKIWTGQCTSPYAWGKINTSSFCLQIIPRLLFFKKRKVLPANQHFAYRACAHILNSCYFILPFAPLLFLLSACLGSVLELGIHMQWADPCAHNY